MNFTEQKNYIIAGIVSLTFHFFLLIIYLPGILASKKPELDTFPVDLVEFSSADPTKNTAPQPENKINPSAALHNQENKQPVQKEIQIKSATNPNQLLKNAIAPSQKAGTTVSGNLRGGLGNHTVSKGNLESKSTGNPNQLPKVTSIPSSKKGISASDNPKKTGNQSILSEDAEEINDLKNSSSNKSQSFGSGKTMVTVLGPMPKYPPDALKEGKEGTAVMRVLVNSDGGLKLVIITKSSGDIRLDYAATSSIERNWRFSLIFEEYYIDLVFIFNIQRGVSIKFLKSRSRG